jgi:hypothetical protein
MAHLSAWHTFGRHDPRTHPKVNSPMQVKYANGNLAEGETLDFFDPTAQAPESPIVGWQYLRGRQSASYL